MKKLLTTAVALFVVGGVTAVAADVTISGNTKFRYHSWSDDAIDAKNSANSNNEMVEDLDLWIGASETSESGLSYGFNMRLKHADNGVNRNWIYIGDDWGRIHAGRDHPPFQKMSLGANWRGSVADAQYIGGVGTRKVSADDDASAKIKTDTWLTKVGSSSKLAYYTPDISGLKIGVSYGDAGGKSGADSTSFAVNYTVDVMNGSALRLGYGFENTDAADNADNTTDTKRTEAGIELTSGDFIGSIVRFSIKDTVNKVYKYDNNTMSNDTLNSDQTGTEVELGYNISENLFANVVLMDVEEKAGANKDDSYKSTQFGVRYTIAPGLLLGVLHNMYKYKDKSHASPSASDPNIGDNSGSATSIELRLNF
jgi:hypothetical protein